MGKMRFTVVREQRHSQMDDHYVLQCETGEPRMDPLDAEPLLQRLGVEYRTGDEVEIEARVVSRLETKRVPVE